MEHLLLSLLSQIGKMIMALPRNIIEQVNSSGSNDSILLLVTNKLFSIFSYKVQCLSFEKFIKRKLLFVQS